MAKPWWPPNRSFRTSSTTPASCASRCRWESASTDTPARSTAIQSRFEKSKPATLYFDEVRTPTYTDCLNRLCETVLAGNLRGLYHAGGPRPLSLYNIAQVINRVGGYGTGDADGLSALAAGPIPPRAGNVSMDSSKLAQALGYQPFHAWPYCESLVPTHSEWHFEHSRRAGQPRVAGRGALSQSFTRGGMSGGWRLEVGSWGRRKASRPAVDLVSLTGF